MLTCDGDQRRWPVCERVDRGESGTCVPLECHATRSDQLRVRAEAPAARPGEARLPGRWPIRPRRETGAISHQTSGRCGDQTAADALVQVAAGRPMQCVYVIFALLKTTLATLCATAPGISARSERCPSTRRTQGSRASLSPHASLRPSQSPRTRLHGSEHGIQGYGTGIQG